MNIADKRNRLIKRLERFHQQAIQHLGGDAIELIPGALRGPPPVDIPDEMRDIEDIPDGTEELGPEAVQLYFPSALNAEERARLGLEDLANKELKVRKGHANDALQSIRLLLGKKSFGFRERLRPAVGKGQKTRAWAAIDAINQEITHFVYVYKANREAMIRLGLPPQELATTYQELQKADLKTSTAILEPNLPGQSTQKLSWIWTQHIASDTEGTHLSECEWNLRQDNQPSDNLRLSVYRVHWLRSRAQLHRWQEELNLTKHEMVWSTGYFIYQSVEWERWRQIAAAAAQPGPAAYAEKQIHRWRALARNAGNHFVKLVPDYNNLV